MKCTLLLLFLLTASLGAAKSDAAFLSAAGEVLTRKCRCQILQKKSAGFYFRRCSLRGAQTNGSDSGGCETVMEDLDALVASHDVSGPTEIPLPQLLVRVRFVPQQWQVVRVPSDASSTPVLPQEPRLVIVPFIFSNSHSDGENSGLSLLEDASGLPPSVPLLPLLLGACVLSVLVVSAVLAVRSLLSSSGSSSSVPVAAAPVQEERSGVCAPSVVRGEPIPEEACSA